MLRMILAAVSTAAHKLPCKSPPHVKRLLQVIQGEMTRAALLLPPLRPYLLEHRFRRGFSPHFLFRHAGHPWICILQILTFGPFAR